MSLQSLFGLDRKVALVTGGARGIGRMIATALCDAGAKVYISSRSQDECERAAGEISSTGRCVALPGDLGTTSGIRESVDRLARWETSLDVLVNNAGSSWGAPLETFPEAKWDSVMDLNVKSPFFLIQACLALLSSAATAECPSRVINVGSAAGIAPSGNSAYSYDVSKAALHHLTRVLALELAPKNISVNAIAPGYFPTRMTGHLQKDEARFARNLGRIPLRRWGRPDEIGGLAVYLAAAAGSYMTGNVIALDGGMLLGAS